MSDADGGPSTSRGTRRSGANPRTPAKPAATVNKERDSREESQASQASSGSRSFANREEKNLFVPSYGGNLFTAPRSNKRETKKNSRFSPTPAEQKTKQKTAADKLSEAAAAFDDKGKTPPVKGKKTPKEIPNLKDAAEQLKSSKTKIPKQVFALPTDFGGRAARLYRQLPKDQWAPDEEDATPAKPRSKSGPSRAIPPSKTDKPTAAALAAFEFQDEPSESKPKRRNSIPAGAKKAVKKELMEEGEEDEEEIEEREDKPQRGRRKSKVSDGKEKEEAHGSRTRVKFEVKEEPIDHSDNDNNSSVEEPVATQPKKRGRKSRDVNIPPPPAASVVSATGVRRKSGAGVVVKQEETSPPPPAASSIGSAPGGRRKSGATVAFKQEPPDEEEEEQPSGRRRSMRGETNQGIKKTIKAEPDEQIELVVTQPKTPRKVVPVKESSPQPSTSAATPAVGRSSRKRGRPAMNKSPPPEEPEEKDPMEQPPVKRKYTRKSTRTSVGSVETRGSEDTKDSGEMEEEKEKKKEMATPGKRGRRTSSQGSRTEVTEEQGEEKKDEGRPTRRRSSRSQGEEKATPVSAKEEKSPKGDNHSAMGSALSRMAGRLNPDGPSVRFQDEIPPEDGMDMGEDEEKSKRQIEGADATESEKEPSTSTPYTSSMLVEEAERSGYEERESSQEDDTEREGTMEGEDEDHASTSLETPAKRGRGRPRKDGKPFKTPAKTPLKTPRKPKEEVEPIVRERRAKAPNPKFAEYINEETLKQTRRASGGAGMATPLRASLDGISHRVRPLTPPPPEVKAAPGSALSIMRNMKKKSLPSMRSPSPTRPGRQVDLGKLAAVVATIADAPPIESEKEKKEKEKRKKKEEGDKPGPSRKSIPQESVKKEEGEEGEQKDPVAPLAADIGSSELARLAEYGSSSESGVSLEEKATGNWITPDCIRGRWKRISLPMEQDPVTGKLTVKEEEVERDEEEKEEKKEEGDEQKKEEEEAPKVEESAADAAEKKEETAQDVLARWNESRNAIDQARAEAGLPALPAEPAPISSRASRRSINAPARFGDYDLNYGDVRKRSATVASPAATLPVSPVLSEGKKRQSKKREESAATPTTRGEDDEPGTSHSGSKKEKHRPRIVLKLKLDSHSRSSSTAPTPAAEEGEEEYQEEGEGDEDDDMMDEGSSPAPPSVLATPATATKAVTASVRSTRSKDRRRVKSKAFAKKWKRRPIPHMGFIELDEKKVESVRLTCAATMDAMLAEICNDGIQKSTLTQKEQASEHSLLSVAKRRALGLILPPGLAGSRPKPPPFVLPPREERTKRIRHAPQSKEYDNLAVSLSAVDPVAPPFSFHAMAGLTERKPQAERRKESRQEAAAIKKASLAAAYEVAATRDVETPVEKPKKEKKKDRDRERGRENAPKKNRLQISYEEFIRRKTYNMERLPGRVLRDTTDFFYREIFTDDPGIPDHDAPEVDVEGFIAPLPDDNTALGSNAIGVVAQDVATKLLAVLPRPTPYPDEDDDGLEEEGREWSEDDMKRALSHHSEARRKKVEEALQVINSQRTANLAVEGTKGEQEVLYTTHQKNAFLLKEALPVYSQRVTTESTWLHRAFIRLLPSYLLPVYLETLRFLRYIDSKHAGVLSKSLLERGVDAEWDDLFLKEATDDDRTEPMLHGSEPATSGTSILSADEDVAATMESVLKTLEKEEEESAAIAPSVPSPDSDQGLVIDEEPSQEEKDAEAAAAAAKETPAAEEKESGEAAVVEKAVVEEVKKPKPDIVSVCAILSEVTEKKVREANTDTITDSINEVSKMGDVIPILVSPVFEMDDAPEDFVIKNRPHEFMYRLIRYASSSPSEFRSIRPRIPSGQCSVAEAMDAAIDFVYAAVKSAVRNKGNKRVILFGWGISCYINLRVAQFAHGISAIVNFAFPLKSGDGWRGTPDDDINITYCPTLFVMGDGADDFDEMELLHLRMNMIQPSGALIIGNSDSQLNVSNLRLSRERITQKVAARIMLEQVIEFINMPANQLERAKLVPCQLNNIYAVEPAAMKAFTGQEAQSAMVTGAGRRPSNYSATIPIEGQPMTAAQSLHRRQQQMQAEERKRKRSRIDEQTTAASRHAQTTASSAAPITKRSRTDDLPAAYHGGRNTVPSGLANFSMPSHPGPSPLASPALHSPGGYRRPNILSHSHHPHHYYGGMQPSPLGGPSTSAAGAASGLLLQTATTRPANAPAAAAPSPRGPLDPASISLS